MSRFSYGIRFSISFGGERGDALEVWRALSEFLRERNCLPDGLRLSQIAGHSEVMQNGDLLDLSSTELEGVIRSRRLTGFHFTAGSGEREIKYGMFKGLNCMPAIHAHHPDDWSPLIERIMAIQESFDASQYQALYAIWQSLRNPDLYGPAFPWGPIPPGYKTYYVPQRGGPALGPGSTKLDTSKNPGRCKLITENRFPFYAAAEMWLGRKFWAYAKCTKEEVLAADFFLEKRDTPHFLYLRSWPTHFTRPDGEQGRIQQKIWKLFFHEDAEWPPGSGTICDEPMYGPPELMPNPPTAG